MQKTIFLFILFLSYQLCQAHNGKIAFAKPVTQIKIDGNSSDWGTIEYHALLDGLPEGTQKADFSTQFAFGYNEEEQALYFIVVVDDDSYVLDTSQLAWYQQDSYILYLNALHSERGPTSAMLIFNEQQLTFEQHDHSQAKLTSDDVQYAMSRKNKQRVYEGKVILHGNIAANKSIGLGLMLVDADKKSDAFKYVAWGKGEAKQYHSGQLGDLVLLKDGANDFGSVKGKIAWERPIHDPLPEVVKIKSVTSPQLWVHIPVDSNGSFSTALPVGQYALQSAFKIASPASDTGNFNQTRLDDKANVQFTLEKDLVKDIGVFQIPLFKPPSYLMEDAGVLHTYQDGDAQKVDHFIETFRKYYNVPGASVALIKEGKVVYNNTFGVENVLSEKPVTEATMFQAASVTKPVFAFIVLRLAEKGIIDLDKPLYQYLPFENLAHDKRHQLLTARIVLSHRSGLPNWAWGGPSGWKAGQQTDFLFEPGAKFGYSGEAFQYLGRVVQHLTDKDLNQLLQQEVIEPLQISGLYFEGNDSLHSANGHYADGYPTFYYMPRQAGVAHTMMSEAKSFATFVAALSNKKGLSDQMYTDLATRLCKADGFDSPDNSYWNIGVGLGFFVQDTPFGKAIMHGGNNVDFQAEFVLFPERKMGFVIFCNSNAGHKLAQALGKYLIYGGK